MGINDVGSSRVLWGEFRSGAMGKLLEWNFKIYEQTNLISPPFFLFPCLYFGLLPKCGVSKSLQESMGNGKTMKPPGRPGFKPVYLLPFPYNIFTLQKIRISQFRPLF